MKSVEMNYSSSVGGLRFAGLLEALCFFLNCGILICYREERITEERTERKWMEKEIHVVLVRKGR